MAGRLAFLRLLAAGMGLSFAVLVSIPPFTALAATVITVTDNTDPFPPTGTCPGPQCTLRAAIAAGLAGDRIDQPAQKLGIGLSPAIDAGEPACPAAGTDEGTDQRGATRPQGPACDIGAFELVPATAPTPPVPVPGPPATGEPATQPGWPLLRSYLGL
jgi:hypothetical protein